MRTSGVAGVAALAALAVGSLAVIAANGGRSGRHALVRTTAPKHTTTVPVTEPRTTSTTRTTAAVTTTVSSTASTTTAASHSAAPTSPPATAASSNPPLLVTRLHGIGGARQVVTVTVGSDSSSIATVSAYEHDASGWRQVFGPWSSYIGRNGVAPVGAKREGDGRTPGGVYGFDFMFGVAPDPGTHYSYRRITGPNIVWDDDPASPNYNEWVDGTTTSAGANPEPMDTTPSYLYGAVISYNDARTPGLGSGIFLHVSHGSPTHGCISLPETDLLEVLRWLDPAESPRIAIGTVASLTSG